MTQTSQLKLCIPAEGRLSSAFNEVASYAGLCLKQHIKRCSFGFIEDTYNPFDRSDWSLSSELESFFQQYPVESAEAIIEKQPDMFDSMENYGVDAAIMGSDKLLENTFMRRSRNLQPAFQVTARFKKLEQTAISRLMICGPDIVNSPQELSGKCIATSYPNLTQAWLTDKGVTNANVIVKTSRVEDMIRRGAANAVCDVVETGGTLKAYDYTPSLKVARVYPVLVESLKTSKATMNNMRKRLKLAVNPARPVPETNSLTPA